MTTYYCMKNQKCPTKTCDCVTTSADIPTCCDTPMTTNRETTTWWNKTNATTTPEMNATAEKTCSSN